jgi:hypothetical protein
MLLSILGVDPRSVMDHSNRDAIVRKAPAIKNAIDAIALQVMEDTRSYVLPTFDEDGSVREKSDSKTKGHLTKLTKIISSVVLLWLNMRLSLEEYVFMYPIRGQEIDSGWMDRVSPDGQVRYGRSTKVLFTVYPALIKIVGDEYESIANALVFPA